MSGAGDEHGETSRPATLRSNSCNFVIGEAVAWPKGQVCPLIQAKPRLNRASTLWLSMPGQIRLCSTQTTDFSEAELLAIKDRYGQLYVDVSRKLAPDDFARDLRKLRELSVCGPCPFRTECGGAWQALSTDVFSHDETRLLGLLAGLKGRILDIGCGDGPYLKAFESAALAGELEYVGVDPDAQRLAVLAERYSWARFQPVPAECGFDALDGSFDHLLVLRSFNHLEDPRSTLKQALARLSRSGTLTIVDNVAFGLVRQRAIARRAEAGPAEYEHFRNADADQAIALLDGLPLELVERWDVSPATSNQWLLHFRVSQASAPELNS
ncbi:MAG: class I SAM-dependent methyltransferase [Polyangiaceae bacterium]|nr:class I SAM-dependent methyltransferase [Polyangiaceae bacterium]